MVTKHVSINKESCFSSVLAKIHMVTKTFQYLTLNGLCSVLAKIHMVTKLYTHSPKLHPCSVLAKIHMVTKPLRLYTY